MTGQSPRSWEGYSVQHKIPQRHMDLGREKQPQNRAGNSSGQRRRQGDHKVPEKGEGLHRLSSKRAKPTTSRRRYQKFMLVAKKSQWVHLQTPGGQGNG